MQVVCAVPALDLGREPLTLRPTAPQARLREEMDHPAERIGAVEGRGRTAQHLHTGNL